LVRGARRFSEKREGGTVGAGTPKGCLDRWRFRRWGRCSLAGCQSTT